MSRHISERVLRDQGLRIKIINPNTSHSMTNEIDRVAKMYKRGETQIVTVSPPYGPIAIDNFYDERLASVGAIQEVKKGLVEHFDAFIIACFSDPRLQAGREVSDMPVVGIGEAAVLLACTVAYRFSIISLPKRGFAGLQELLRRYGLDSRCASIRLLDQSVAELNTTDETRTLLLAEARKAIDEDGAEAILLGWAGLGGLDKELEKELGVPVIDGAVAAVKLLEAIHDYGLKTRKILTYQPPERKTVIGFPGIFQDQRVPERI